MSKKSKKILAYLMFVAALCGTPAVSEARGGSGGQVKTEKASGAQRGGDLSQSFISYLIKNYGFEAFKWTLLGGGGFGTAKFLKAGDLSTWASYLFDMKNADLEKAEKLMKQYDAQKAVFDKEKEDFNVQRAKALEDNEKLNNEKVAFELSNNKLDAKVKENEQKIKELENSKAKLDNEVLDLKNYNNQLLNLNNEDNKKIDALLSGLLPYKMSGELNTLVGNLWKEESYKDVNKVVVEPYSGKEGVKVVIMKYDGNGNALNQQPEWLTLPADGIIDAIKNKVGIDLANISFKDIGLDYCGVSRLARYAFVSYNEEDEIREVVAAYFPVKSFQLINNVENDENNENVNENNNVNNEENNENLDKNEKNLNENEQNVNNNENVVNNENNVNNENVNNEGDN